MKSKRISINKIKTSGIKHEVLPADFIDRVLKYKETLKDVETISLEETIGNFQRDLFPEIELLWWENVASLYRQKISQNPSSDLDEKRKIFKDIFTNLM